MSEQDCRFRLGVAEARLCLDFVNTEGTARNDPPERLGSLELLLDWAVAKGALAEAGRELQASAELAAATADALLGRARELREALYRIFKAHLAGGTPDPDDLTVLDRELAAAVTHLTLAWTEAGARWTWRRPPPGLEGILWRVAASAADLLGSDKLDRVKECDSATCSWMFVDESRNRSRRWCDMADCGNRAKVRRYHQRRRRGTSCGPAT